MLINSLEKVVIIMFCPKCGNSLADDAKFCNVCGTAMNAPAEQPVVPQYTEPQYVAPQPAPQPSENPGFFGKVMAFCKDFIANFPTYFKRFMANKPLFFGTIGGVSALLIVIVLLASLSGSTYKTPVDQTVDYFNTKKFVNPLDRAVDNLNGFTAGEFKAIYKAGCAYKINLTA